MRKRPAPTTHPGLTNPEVAIDETPASSNATPPKFQTHIAEPRWQQVASIILVIIAALVWWAFVLH